MILILWYVHLLHMLASYIVDCIPRLFPKIMQLKTWGGSLGMRLISVIGFSAGPEEPE